MNIFSKTCIFEFVVFLSILGNCRSDCDESLSTADDETNLVFEPFMKLLEKKTGISELTPKYTVRVSCESGIRVCLLNPNGTAIWDARMKLYANHMRQSKSKTNTNKFIEDCYCLEVDAFNTCMETVRTEMIAELDSKFDTYVVDLLEKDSCTSFDDNCVDEQAL